MTHQHSSVSAAGLLKKVIALPFSVAGYLAFEPVTTGLLLYGLTKAPSQIRDQLLRPLQGSGLPLDRLVTPLKYLFAIGIARRIHHVLDRLALNYWHIKRHGEPWRFGDEKLSELILITGGCSGFGALMTKGFAGKARVVVVDVSELPEDLAKLPGVYYYKCDITDASEVASVAATIRQNHGNPSVLINNAGLGIGATVLESSVQRVEKIFATNLVSHFVLIKEFLPAMLEARKGHIVTMGSIASFLSMPGIVHYCCTKTAVNYLNDGLRSELLTRYRNGHTICMTSVHPTFHDTPMIKSFRSGSNRSGFAIYPAEGTTDRVVEHVLQGKSGKLYIPESYYWVSFLKMLPMWFTDVLTGHLKQSLTGERRDS